MEDQTEAKPMTTDQIVKQARYLANILIDNPDMDDATIDNMIEAFGATSEDKVRGYTFVLRRMDAESAALKLEIERLSVMKASVDGSRDRAEARLLSFFDALRQTFGKSPKFAGVSLRRSERTVIEDERAVPEEFKVKKVVETVSVDKMAVKDAIKKGVVVAGAKLQDTWSLVGVYT